jgi:hypothetical protein
VCGRLSSEEEEGEAEEGERVELNHLIRFPLPG